MQPKGSETLRFPICAAIIGDRQTAGVEPGPLGFPSRRCPYTQVCMRFLGTHHNPPSRRTYDSRLPCASRPASAAKHLDLTSLSPLRGSTTFEFLML